jgi:hypothetical protein
MSYFRTRALRWAAPVALVGVIGLTACGDDADSTKAETVAERPGSSAASIRASQAAEAERYVELQQDRAASVSSNRASLAAEAEAYVELQQERAASSSTESSTDGFVPGSRHMPIG